jgi:serine/threonine protein kinase
MQGNIVPFPVSDVRHTVLTELCGSTVLFQNRYQVLQVLGKGGFGVTFLARDMQLPSTPACVIKQLCPKLRDEGAFGRAIERFEREAKILGELGGHAQIPTLLNYFRCEGGFFLVQEYIKGQTLGRLVKQQGPWTEAQVKGFLREIIPVLQYIHRNGVIHRDIKPPNLIRCQDTERLVLLDFGAVKEGLALSEEKTHTSTTHFVGTMGFAPPEQLALRSNYATDVYAVGMTCIFLLTGRAPSKLTTDPQSGEYRWRHLTDVSDAFVHVLDHMTKLSLRERYQSVDKVLKMLDLSEISQEMQLCLHRQDPTRNTPHPFGQTLPPASGSVTQSYGPYVSPAERMAQSIRARRDRQTRQNTTPRGGWDLRKQQPELMYSR